MSFLRRVMVCAALALGACAAQDDGPSVPAADASMATLDAGAGQLPFMAECASNEQCQTGNCYPFGMKGPHCTKPCTSAADCPAPSPGCNNKGLCKAP
jgi:hypothetical protein